MESLNLHVLLCYKAVFAIWNSVRAVSNHTNVIVVLLTRVGYADIYIYLYSRYCENVIDLKSFSADLFNSW